MLEDLDFNSIKEDVINNFEYVLEFILDLDNKQDYDVVLEAIGRVKNQKAEYKEFLNEFQKIFKDIRNSKVFL